MIFQLFDFLGCCVCHRLEFSFSGTLWFPILEPWGSRLAPLPPICGSYEFPSVPLALFWFPLVLLGLPLRSNDFCMLAFTCMGSEDYIPLWVISNVRMSPWVYPFVVFWLERSASSIWELIVPWRLSSHGSPQFVIIPPPHSRGAPNPPNPSAPSPWPPAAPRKRACD